MNSTDIALAQDFEWIGTNQELNFSSYLILFGFVIGIFFSKNQTQKAVTGKSIFCSDDLSVTDLSLRLM